MTFVRMLAWRAGAPARLVLLGMITAYRVTLSGWLGGQCRFFPTCSRYAEEAIRTHGAVRGSLLAARRVFRCNPFGRGGVDPVPSVRVNDAAYDAAIRHTAVSSGRHAG